MARQVLEIHPEQRIAPDAIHYNFDLSYSQSSRRERLFYEAFRQPGIRPVETYDGVLCALVLHAMAERRDIRLHGPATEAMLRNLREFQRAWSRWLPGTYQPIEVLPDSTVDVRPPAETSSISAFSGGVDSLFTVFSHTGNPCPTPPTAEGALLVHGFDVSLNNTKDFEELIDRTAGIRDATGVSLRLMRTNSKALGLQNWEDSFAAQLAACMHFCSSEFSVGLIGSSEPYDALVLPWGSNPVTDHLLSGGAMQIVHDGAGFSRTEKVAFLSRYPEALRALKVCWEGTHQGRNCGVCEKCVRTQLNLLAVGITNAPCFDGPLDFKRIAFIRMQNDAVLTEFRSICEYAEQQGIEAEWLDLLRARLRRGKANRTVKGSVKDLLRKFGLLEIARSVRGRKVSTGRYS